MTDDLTRERLRMKTKKAIWIVLVCCVAILCSCGLFKTKIKVMPEPSESTVRLDGRPVGSGVVEVVLPEEDNLYAVEVCGPPEYFCETFNVKGNTQQKSFPVKLVLDSSFKETVDLDVANKFVRIPVAGNYKHEEAWQKLVSCVNDSYSDLETLDGRSGYLKTAWKVKDYGYPRQRKLRARIIASIDSSSPLQYKVKLEMQKFRGGDSWDPHGRVFMPDSDAVNCVRGRLQR